MRRCSLVQHPKWAAIEAALKQQRHLAVIARQFRVNLQALAAHHGHECLCFRAGALMMGDEPASTQVLAHVRPSMMGPRLPRDLPPRARLTAALAQARAALLEAEAADRARLVYVVHDWWQEVAERLMLREE